MSQGYFGAGKGYDIHDDDGSLLFRLMYSTSAPVGTGEQADAPIGSLLARSNGELYQKVANAGAPADWELNGSSSAVVGSWRKPLKALTNDTVTAGVARDLVASPFADDETPLLTAADFTVGDFIVADADGTPVLLEVTAVSAPNVTFSTPVSEPALSANDTFLVENYLPDSPGAQEGYAISNYNGSIMVKIGDIDWDFATGINISSGYTAQNGSISSADSVESAIEKLDGNQQDLTSAVGVAQGDVDMGTYTGTLLNDNESAKQNIQQLETEAEALRSSIGGSAGDTDMGTYTGDIISDNVDQRQVNQELETAIEANQPKQFQGTIAQNTPTTVDTVLCDEIQKVRWAIVARDQGTRSALHSYEVTGLHNGHSTSDASATDSSRIAIDRIGIVNLQYAVVLAGAGSAQTMGLELDTNDADGIYYTVERIYELPLLG